jgi:AcrR family transcriptional regulator
MAKGEHSARQQIMETASRLFYEQGFRAVGIDTIIAQSGVAKMSLYRHFPSKDDLIVAYLEQSNAQFWEWFEGVVSQHPASPRRQLAAIFEGVVQQVGNPVCFGCTFQSTAAEFPDVTHKGHAVALAHKKAVRERFYRMALAGQARQPEVLADGLLMLMDGAYVEKRMYGDQNPARNVALVAEVVLAAHFGPDSI